MLLDLGRPADALKEFEATLKKEPNRFRATYHAAKAAAAAGNAATARTYYRQLLDTCKAGDAPGRPELEEARKKGRRKKEEGRRKKEEGRRKKEEDSL